MFVFGSSVVDNGNNNFLQTLSRANYLPYGLDFPVAPASGRFTNGKNIIDLLAKLLGLPIIPPFLDPLTKGPRIARGVNFASGGSELGCGSKESLSHFLFVVGTGGNDYSFNYFLQSPPDSDADTDEKLQAFTSNLTASLSQHLQKLYGLGARKFVLISVNPIGCYPYVKASRPMVRGCVQSMNRAARLFNSNLVSLANDLPARLPHSHFVVVNSYKIMREILKNPTPKGFTNTEEPCCEVPSMAQGGNGILCRRGGSTCSNRSSYAFFDGIHPSEAVNDWISYKAFSSYLWSEVYPFNVRHLAWLV
ncbi:hypothetical protein CRG98_025309 [Punica granatum]|uniref:Uncharacterized protein n=1 Tax=Punica granatum TaxID=22663 RepID=A0A2I0JDG4_PUNGR|nr:hypothetical protein CRG98_025309 [Punica granatum]